MLECDGQIVDFFTKGSHHRNLSVMFITQNIFHHARGMRDISLNSYYMVCKDRAQINYLSLQRYPNNTKYIQETYDEATRNAYGYLLFDLKQNTD